MIKFVRAGGILALSYSKFVLSSWIVIILHPYNSVTQVSSLFGFSWVFLIQVF